MSSNDLSNVTKDFIFGTLATDNLRLEELKKRSRGLWHGNRTVPVDPSPGETVEVLITVGGDVSIDSAAIHLTIDGSMPTAQSRSIPMQLAKLRWDTLAWAYLEEWSAILPAQPDGTLVRYRISATSNSGEIIWADVDVETGDSGLFAYSVDTQRVPQWLRSAVIYQVFVDRFAPAPGRTWLLPDDLNGVWGGTLAGLMDRLDHIADLGATAIWLSPVFPSPTHHGYDATDYTSIEPRLGTEDDLRRLIDAAHARGLKVLLDFVANHVSDQHPAFQEAKANPSSPNREWFTFREDGTYQSFFGVGTMPEIAVDHDSAADYLIEAAMYWLEQGIDGFRLDYANGPSHAFWARFRQALRALNPDVALIGEVVESADLMASYEGRLDGTLDFLLLQQIRAFLAFDQITPSDFWRFVSRHLEWFPDEMVLPSFLDNHDMNRFLWVSGDDVRRLKLAALLQLALPHPPVIYYGTEVGLSQWHDLEYPDGSRRMEESRTPMLWGKDQDANLKNFYRSLIFWRRRFRIESGSPMLVHADDDATLMLRTGDFIVAVNRSQDDRDVDASSLGQVALMLGTDFDVQFDGAVLHLPAMSGAIIAMQARA